MPDCPNCKKTLTDDQLKSLWASRSSALRINHKGGPKITCKCGKCRKCKQRVLQRKWRTAAALTLTRNVGKILKPRKAAKAGKIVVEIVR